MKQHKSNQWWKKILWLLAIPYFYGWFYYENGRGNGIYLYAVLLFALSAQLYFFIKYFNAMLCDPMLNTRLIIKRIIWLVLLSGLFQLSIYRRFFEYYTWEYLWVAIGRFSMIFVTLFCVYHWLGERGWTYEPRKAPWWHMIIFMVPMLITSTIVWLGFFPAIMTPDSVYLWGMAQTRGPYNDLHPLLYTFMLRALMAIWHNPAVVVVFQMMLFSGTIAYIAWRFESWGVRFDICLLAAILCAIIPTNYMYNISIWKDVPYTVGLLLLMAEVIRSRVQADYYNKWPNLVVLGLIMCFTMAMRHNGIPIVTGTAVLVSLTKLSRGKRKQGYKFAMTLVAALVLLFGTIGLVKLRVGDNFKEKEKGIMTFGIPVQGYIYVYHEMGDALPEEDRELIDRYLDIEGVETHIKKYNFDSHWSYYGRAFNTADSEAILQDKIGFLKGYVYLATTYPELIRESYARMSSLVWCSRHCSYVSNLGGGVFQAPGYVEVEQKIVVPKINEWVRDNLGYRVLGYKEAYWHPAYAMIAMLLLLGLAWRRHGMIALAIIAPPLLNALSYLPTLESQDTRYMYVNFTAFFVFLGFAMLHKKHSKNNEQSAAKDASA